MTPTTITPDEARARFGELRSGRTYSEFETPEGVWRPEFGPGMVLERYRLYPPVKPTPTTRPRLRAKR